MVAKDRVIMPDIINIFSGTSTAKFNFLDKKYFCKNMSITHMTFQIELFVLFITDLE